MAQFLSEEWIEAARDIRARYADQVSAVPHKIRMNQVITDVPFGTGEVRLYVDTTSGQMAMEFGELPDADVTVTTDYETARKVFVEQDAQGAMQAFMAGKVRIQGDMTKLMLMQGTPPDDVARQVAAEIKSITE